MKWNVAISACCVVLLAANIALIHQNSQLKAQLSLPPPALEVAAGTQMPDLRGFDPEGKPVEVRLRKRPAESSGAGFFSHVPFLRTKLAKVGAGDFLAGPLGRSSGAVDVTSTTTSSVSFAAPAHRLPVLERSIPGHDELSLSSHATDHPG